MGGKCSYCSQNFPVFMLPLKKHWILVQTSANFSVKCQTVHNFGFRDQPEDIGAVTHLCLCSMKAATDNRQTQVGVAVF